MKIWLRIAVSGGLLLVLLLLIPWDIVRTAIARLPFLVWLTVIAGFFAGHALGVVKWRMIVSAGGRKLHFADAVRCYAAGLFANMCLPGVVGGDVLRAALAARTTGSPEAAVLGGLVDRAVDVATLAVLVAAGGFFARSVLPGWGQQAFYIGVITTAVVLVIFLPLAVRRPLARWPRRFRRRVGRALVALRSLSRRPGTALAALAISVIVQSFFVVLNVWIGRSVGIAVPLAVWFLAWPLAKAAGLLPISLGGLGVRDATFAALLVPVGVPLGLGLVASLVWQSVLIVGGLLAGILWWGMARYNKSSSSGPNRRGLPTAAASRPYA